MDRPAIDEEFRSMIPPLRPEERVGLEASILAEGCRDSLVTWRGTLLDGHNRLAICEAHGIDFSTVAVELPDRNAALVWVIRNQFARRNLTPFQRSELALQLEPLIAGRAKENQTKSRGRGKKGSQNSANLIDTRATIAKAAGVSHDTIAKAKVIAAKADDATKAKVRAGELSINAAHTAITRADREAKREAKRKANAQKVSASPDPTELIGTYSTIVIDPPWDWGDEGDVNQLGRAKPDYATMSREELMELPVGRLAADDAHLYLWVTNRSIPKAFSLVSSWGFRWVTMLTWPKPSFGMGNYFRGQTEHVAFAVRGSLPLSRKDASTLLPAWPRGGGCHSSKPAEFAEFVESCSPGPYLEMFARSERNRWTSWGADA